MVQMNYSVAVLRRAKVKPVGKNSDSGIIWL